MDLARFLGELVADIVGVFAHLLGHRLQLRQRLLLRLAHGKRYGFLLAGRGNGRGHQRLLDLVRAAAGAIDKTALLLRVEIVIAAKPTLELMLVFADQGKADQDAAPLRRGASPALMVKSRAFLRLGIFLRAASDCAGSISATITAGSSCAASAMMRPHGSTISECP